MADRRGSDPAPDGTVEREATSEDSRGSLTGRGPRARRDRAAAGAPGGAPDGGPERLPAPYRIGLAALTALGALLLVVAEFSTLFEVVTSEGASLAGGVFGEDRAQQTGLEQHGGGLLLVAALAMLMAAGVLRAARPAMTAVAVAGVLVILLAALKDFRDVDRSGLVKTAQRDYFEAEGEPRRGLYLETAGGVVLLLAGGLGLLLLARPPAALGSGRAASAAGGLGGRLAERARAASASRGSGEPGERSDRAAAREAARREREERRAARRAPASGAAPSLEKAPAGEGGGAGGAAGEGEAPAGEAEPGRVTAGLAAAAGTAAGMVDRVRRRREKS